MPTITKKIPLLKCAVCGREWQQRGANKPGKCPNQKCQSANWDQKPPRKARATAEATV